MSPGTNFGGNAVHTTKSVYRVAWDKLSAAERALFDAIDKNALYAVRNHNVRFDRANIKLHTNKASYKIPPSILHAVWLRAERDLKAGFIDQELFNDIDGILASEQNEAVTLQYYNKYSKKSKNHNDDFDLERAQTATEEFIGAVHVTSRAKEYARKVLAEAELQAALTNSRNVYTLMNAGFMDQWAAGEFNYHYNFFSNEQDVREFVSYLTLVVFGDKLLFYTPPNYATTVKEATTALINRLIEYEKPRWAQAAIEAQAAAEEEVGRKQRLAKEEQEAKAEADRRKAQEAQAAQQRAEEESQRYARFMAEPQPYVWESQAIVVREQLSELTRGLSAGKKNAERLVNIVKEAHSLLDTRDSGIKELGNILFSAANLVASARAFGLENQTKQFGMGNSNLSNANRQRLRRLYDSSEKVREVVDKLLEREDGIILLATRTRSEERCKEYTQFITSQTTLLMALQNKVAEDGLEGFPPEFMNEFRDDPLIRNRIALAERLEARTNLEKEIRQAFGGRKHIADSAIVVSQTRRPDFELPAGWLTKLNEEGFHAEASTEGSKHIRICSNQYPYVSIDIKLHAAEATFNERLITLRAMHEQEATNKQLEGELIQDCGFEFKDNHLYHREYGIDLSLANGAETTLALCDAKERFKERRFQQESMIGSITRTGIGVTRDIAPPAITLQHPGFSKPYTLAPRGYFSKDDFTITENLINTIIRQQPQPVTGLIEETEAPVPTQSKTTLWTPPAGQTMLFYDTTTFKLLATPREKEGHSWLDLVKCTARLPNVKVLIPATIACLELQGRIPDYDLGNPYTKLKVVNPHFLNRYSQVGKIAEPIRKLLESASVGQMTGEGVVNLQTGANQNIIIIETEKDRELFKEIEKIMKLPPSQQEALFQEKIYKKHHGENSINHIIASLPKDVAAMIVSDDLKYFNGTGGKESVAAPATTGRGMPVGLASSVCYLDAEFSARAPVLRGYLAERDALTISRLSQAMNEHWQSLGSDAGKHMMTPYSKSGRYAEPNGRGEPDSIYTLIHSGTALAASAKKSGNGNGNGHRSDPASVRGIAPVSIAPNGVNGRSGASPQH